MRKSRKASSRQHRLAIIIVLIVSLMLSVVPTIYGQDIGAEAVATPFPPTEAPTETPVPTETAVPTEEATETPVPTEVVTETPLPTEEATETPLPTEEATETAVPTEEASATPDVTPEPEVTPEATPDIPAEPPVAQAQSMSVMAGPSSATCEMQINNAGDSSALTWTLVANATNIDSYEWFINNVSVSTDPTYTHTFPGVGSYDIRLVCTSLTLGDLPVTGYVNITSIPDANFSVSPLGGTKPLTIYTSNLSTGDNLTYAWTVTDVNSGTTLHTSSAFNFNYTFSDAGTYRVTLTVSTSAGSDTMSVEFVVIEPPPLADFTLSNTAGTFPLIVTVEGIPDASSGPITAWSWSVTPSGNLSGNSGAGPHTVEFTAEGTYTIRMDYSGPGGGGWVEKQVVVMSDGAPLVAEYARISSTNGAGSSIVVCFENQSEGPIARNMWDFNGDGTYDVTDNSAVVCTTYPTDGAYTVKLRVENLAGDASAEAEYTFNVVQSPVAYFTSTSPIQTGDSITFNGSDSVNRGGQIDLWTWTINGTQVASGPSNSSYTATNAGNSGSVLQYGANTIRLTVSGPGGSSFVESIVTVERRALGCDFSGTFSLAPAAGAQTYTSSVTGASGRTVSYSWLVQGNGVNASFSTTNLTYTFPAGEGTYNITLRGSTADGASCTVTKTVTITYPALTCNAITGNVSPLPNGSNYNYTASAGNIAGRTLTYVWFVNGSEVQRGASNTLGRSWTVNNTTDNIQVQIIPSQGTPCTSAVKTVTAVWPNLTCSISGNLVPLPNNTSYTYTANVGAVNGRTGLTYEWSVDNVVVQSGPSTTLNRQYTVTGHTEIISLRVIPQVGQGDPCSSSVNISAEYSDLICWINGSTTPRPNMPSDPSGINSYTYSAGVSGDDGRTLTYTWKLDAASAGSATSFTQNWPWTEIGNSYTFRLEVIATNYDGTTEECNDGSHTESTVTVTMPALSCPAPTGDTRPVIGETVPFNYSVSNEFGRTRVSTLWELEQETSPGVWTQIETSPNASYSYQFNDPDASYRVRYTVVHATPDQNCTSGWMNITTPTTGADFTCDAWVTSYGDFTPESSSTSYRYRVNVDNTNGLMLDYSWVLVDAYGAERVVATQSSTIDGDVTIPAPGISGADLGPVGNKTLRVDVSSLGTPHKCSLSQGLVVGTWNVSFTRDVTAANIAIGQQVCLDNTSTTSHNGIDGLTYAWDFGTVDNSLGIQTSTAQEPGCLSFSKEGTYTITLVGTNAYGETRQQQVTYSVWREQSILISRTDANFYAGQTFGFSATGVNINSYSWNIYNSSNVRVGAANRSGTSISQQLNTPGQYRVTVRGTGPLGTTDAELYVNVIAADDVRAAFRPSQYAGVAPMRVCFTDASRSNAQLNQWEWDLDGNGSYELVYDRNNIPAEICRDYTVAGQRIPISLRVTNSSGRSANATNIIRTYTAQEAANNFAIQPQGGALYCFDPVLSGGSTVVGWSFGDGSADSTATGRVCHTFPGAGSYLVTMKLNGGGEVVREVVVDPESDPPVLSMTATCGLDRTASFVISNTGAAMTTPDTLTIRDENGTVVAIRVFTVGANASITVNVENMSGPVTGALTDSSSVTASTNCNYAPQISITGACVNTTEFRFTITNPSDPKVGPMHTGQSYTITNSGGTQVASGSFDVDPGETLNVDLTGVDPYETYTFSSTGYAGTFSITENCGSRPVLTITSVCADPAQFTITNTGGPMLLSQPITVVDASNNAVTASANSFQLATGASLTVTLPGADPYAAYTLSTSGYAGGSSSRVHNCADPAITVSATCAYPVVFTISNGGSAGNMLSSQNYTIENSLGNVVASGSFNLNANGSQTVTLTGLDPYDTYTFITNGHAATINQDHNCARPVLVITSTCANPAQFTIQNTGGAMLTSQPITVVDASSNTVTASASSFTLAAGASLNVTLPGVDPYAEYTLTTSGFAGGSTSHTHNCANPVITVDASCTYPVVFTISNDGAAGDMLLAQNYTIKDSLGTTVASGSFNLTAGADQTVTLTGLDPYDTYTFTSSGYAATINYSHDCTRPVLEITSVCADPAEFTITNNGGDMLTSQLITVVDASSNAVTPTATSFQLVAGDSLTVTLPNVDPYAAYTLTTSGFAAGETSHTHNCADPVLTVTAQCDWPVVFTVTNGSGAGTMLSSQDYTIEDSLGNVVASGNFNLPAGGTYDIPLTALDPYDTYTFASDDYAGTLDLTHHCDRPNLTMSGLCVSPVEFTITNTGGKMLLPQAITVTGPSGNVTPSVSNFQLDAGDSITVSLPGADPYLEYTLTTSGFAAGETSHTQNCADPGLTVESLCAIPVTFTITNNGREMLQPQGFTITNSLGDVVITGDFTLAAGASQVVELTDLDPYDTYTFASDDYAGKLDLVHHCDRPVLQLGASCEPIAFIVTNTGGKMTGEHPFEVFDGQGSRVQMPFDTVQLDTNESKVIVLPTGIDPYGATMLFTEYGVQARLQNECPRPPEPAKDGEGVMEPTPAPGTGINGVWADQPVCGHNCPDFRLYHTDETGDWEIFRLDGADEETRTTDRRNISESQGEGVKDMAPSLSPNTRYVVFSSNRATEPGQPENWELYVAPSEGGDPDAVIRMTYNREGNDTDPVWGPNNFVVFESNRNGNWDLFVIDMSTAEEYQLTINEADDINPTWSPDGQKLAFQSNREGKWMIYEFDLNTGEITRLSDGSTIDVEPVYSFDGTRIAFRSYTEEDARSVIEVMDADGSGRRAITRPEEDATNHTWSPFDTLIAYQSDEDGDLDVYAFEFGSGTTRKITDNTINDYAPTWRCDGVTLIFTSDINGNPDIYEEQATPIIDPSVRVEDHSDQLTFDTHQDIYPMMSPAEENASREGQTPIGEYGEQTVWLEPDVSLRPINLGIGGLIRDGWTPLWSCDDEVDQKPDLVAPPAVEQEQDEDPQ